MKPISLLFRLTLTLLLVGTLGAGYATAEEFNTRHAVETLELYFDLLVSGNLESAAGLWVTPVVERSQRFGIRFDDIPLKLDCASPVVRNLDVMRDHVARAARQVEVIANNEFCKLQYGATVNKEEVTHKYYSYYDGQYFWLTHAQDFYSRSWPVVESRYFRVHFEPHLAPYLHEVALEEADRFVEETGQRLGLSDEVIRLIAMRKIEYYYCGGDDMVEGITGHRTRGMLDLATNDIISAFFPHFHEVSHLLINIRLSRLPLYTLPLLREGLAVNLGGRWGKGPAALHYLAAFLQDQQLVHIDSVLTMDQFEKHASADMAYPVVGLFAAYLETELGLDGLMRLYRDFSGPFGDLYALSPADIQSRLATALGKDSWEMLLVDYAAFANKTNGEEALFLPGVMNENNRIFEGDNVRFWEDDGWVSLEVTGADSAAPVGTLLFGKNARLEGQSSSLFEEQHSKEQKFEGYRFGVRFDGNEAGLYDYVTNTLLGKFIFGLTPNESYFGDEGRSIRVKFRSELSNGAVPVAGDFNLILE